MRLLRGAKPSPATVIACIALLISLTGTSVAAVSQLGRNTVGTPQLKNNAVTSKKVKNKTLTRADFKSGTLLRGPAGPRGGTGANGANGAAGAAGAPGAPGAPGPSDAFSRFRNGPVVLDFFAKPSIGHLDIPLAGSYVVFAKAWIDNNAGSGDSDVECDLVLSSGDFDRGRVGLDETGVGPAEHGIMALNVAGTVAAGGTADLNCRNFGGGSTSAHFIKITAIKVGNLTNTAQ